MVNVVQITFIPYRTYSNVVASVTVCDFGHSDGIVKSPSHAHFRIWPEAVGHPGTF